MKSLIPALAFCALLGAAGSAQATIISIPNGDFEIAAGDQWNFAPLPPSTVVTFPATGGNPGGYGKIDATAGAWGGVLVAEGGTGPAPTPEMPGIPLATLGLTAGDTYPFSWDQIDLAVGGSGEGKLAGIKIEAWAAGAKIGESGDQLFPTTPAWKTESYPYTIPVGTEAIKVVMVENQGDGIAGFDNIAVDDGAVPPAPVAKEVPNADFELGSASWAEIFDGAGLTTYNYPATGGNPGAYGEMINTSGWGIWVANNNSPQSLTSLGVAEGDTIIIKQDMKIIAGSTIGGMKVDFVPAGSTGDTFIPLIGDGTTWETYSYEVVIPAGTTAIKVVPLWGAASTVGYDNVKITCPVEPIFAASVNQTTQVSWTPTDPAKAYQPQESPDNSAWTNLGPELLGTGVDSVCDSTNSPFYRVLETTPGSNVVLDPSFEISGFWATAGSPAPTEVNSMDPGEAGNSHSGEWAVRMAVNNGTGGAAQTSTLQQVGASGTASAGTTYDFSFWTKIESINGAVMNYSLQWRKSTGDVISLENGDIHTLPVGSWMKVSALGLVAPAETDSVLIQFNCVTGAEPNIEGSYLLDDISLADASTSSSVTLPATSAPGIEVSWPSQSGSSYQVNSGSAPNALSPLGSSIPGTGSTQSICDSINMEQYYNVVETP